LQRSLDEKLVDKAQLAQRGEAEDLKFRDQSAAVMERDANLRNLTE